MALCTGLDGVPSQQSTVSLAAAALPRAQTGSAAYWAVQLGEASVQQVSTADLLDQYLAHHAGVEYRLSGAGDGGTSASPSCSSSASQHTPTAGPQPICSTLAGSGQPPQQQVVSMSATVAVAAASQQAAAAQEPFELSAPQQRSTPTAGPNTVSSTWGPASGLQIQHISLEFSQGGSSSTGVDSSACSSQATRPATPQAANEVAMNATYPETSSSCKWDHTRFTINSSPSTMAGSEPVTHLPDLVGATEDSLAALDTILHCLDHIVQAVLLR